MPHFLKMSSFSLQPTGLGLAEGTPNRRPMHSTTSSFGARPVKRFLGSANVQPINLVPRKKCEQTKNNGRTKSNVENTPFLSNFSMKAGLSSLHAFRLMSSVKINHPFGPGLTSRAPTVNLEARMCRVESKVSTFHRVKCRFVGGSMDSNSWES